MRILFLSRVHPPVVGGLENQSYNLVQNFKEINKETFVIANTKGKKALPYFLPLSFFKSLYLIWKHNITHVHLSDGVLAPLGNLLKKLTGVTVAVTIHGLDITYPKSIYQKIIPKNVNKLDTIICISQNTMNECVKKGIDKKKCVVVPNGINTDEFVIKKSKKELREGLAQELTLDLKGKKILFTSGRLIKRKGVAWFVNFVMPKLPKNYIYLISGDGVERETIEKAIARKKLGNRVRLLGRTDFAILRLLYNSADVFIMPNISVKGDVEGFGLVAVESASCGLPVVASDVDGISDAVIHGKTGYLVKEKNVKEFVSSIKKMKLRGNTVRAYVKNHFDWKKVVKKYRSVIA